MNPTQALPEKKATAHLRASDRLPAATKERAILQDRAEKATGPKRAAWDKAFPGKLP
jgi:hypothetical protein